MALRAAMNSFGLAFVCAVITLAGFSSANAMRWDRFLRCRELILHCSAPRGIDLDLSEGVGVFGYRVWTPDSSIASVERRLFRVPVLVTIYLPRLYNAEATATAIGLAGTSVAYMSGAWWGARIRRSRSVAGVVRPRRCISALLRIPICFAGGMFAWYATAPHDVAATSAGIDDLFVPAGAGGWLVMAGALCLTGRAFARVTSSRPASAQQPGGWFGRSTRCRLCHYDLSGVAHAVCPECGLGLGASRWAVIRMRWKQSLLLRLCVFGGLMVMLVLPPLATFATDGRPESFIQSTWRWITLRSSTSAPAWRGTMVPFLPVPLDAPMYVETPTEEIVLRIRQIRGPAGLPLRNTRFAIATRARSSADGAQAEWEVRSGTYPRPGAAFEILCSSPSTCLVTEFRGGLLSPAGGGYTSVSVVLGRITRVYPGDPTSELDRRLESEVSDP